MQFKNIFVERSNMMCGFGHIVRSLVTWLGSRVFDSLRRIYLGATVKLNEQKKKKVESETMLLRMDLVIMFFRRSTATANFRHTGS